MRGIRRMLAAALALLALLAAPAQARQPMAAIVVDARTGQVLFARQADSPRYPASISKVMTLYLLFREIRAGRMSLNTRLKVSRNAALKPPSKLWLKPGQSITVDQAIRALAVKSANDVAVVVAENIAGSEAAFARRMTAMARALGMTRTTFRNASGLPNPPNVSTARDLATLSLRLMRDFPRLYKRYFALKTFTWRGRRMRNHNRLLWRVAGMDGIKTGYTRAAGSNLAASVRRNGKRIVAVVLGMPSARARNAYMARLIEQSFRRYRLARGTRIAALAGTPPGWNARRARLAAARLRQASSSARKAARKMRNDRQAAARTQHRQQDVAAMPARGQARKLARLALQATAMAGNMMAAVPPKPRPAPRTVRQKPVSAPVMPRAARTARQAPGTSAPAAETAKVKAAVHVRVPEPAHDTGNIPAMAASSRQKERVMPAAFSGKLAARVAVRVPSDDEGPDRPGAALPASPDGKASAPSAPAAEPLASLRILRQEAMSGDATNEDADAGEVVIVKQPADAAPAVRASAETAVSAPVVPAAGKTAERQPNEVGATLADAAKAKTNGNGEGEEILSANPQRARELMAARWLIQIGAFPTLEGAREYLRKARRLSRNVRGREAVVIRVRRGNSVFYRARYAGMSRRQAVRACRELKRRGLGCLPIAPGAG